MKIESVSLRVAPSHTQSKRANTYHIYEVGWSEQELDFFGKSPKNETNKKELFFSIYKNRKAQMHCTPARTSKATDDGLFEHGSKTQMSNQFRLAPSYIRRVALYGAGRFCSKLPQSLHGTSETERTSAERSDSLQIENVGKDAHSDFELEWCFFFCMQTSGPKLVSKLVIDNSALN